jgi:hypothetical protein
MAGEPVFKPHKQCVACLRPNLNNIPMHKNYGSGSLAPHQVVIAFAFADHAVAGAFD